MTKTAFKIGVLSDTHDQKLPPEVLKDFKTVDFIIHAGDVCDFPVYDELKKLGEVHAVCGNMDSPQLCAKLPKKDIIKCGRFQVGLFHGEGPPQTILEKVREKFKKDKVDCVVFGHSHTPFNEKIDGVLYFNPGSPTDTIYAPYRSYGILEITEDGIVGRIIKIGKVHG